jgi:hypothetical protein
MSRTRSTLPSRRAFCFCCAASAGFAATRALAPRQAYAEARGLVSLIKDSAATSPIVTHKLRGNISALEGSGGNIAVLTGSDGKVMVDSGIGVSRPQLMKALADLGPEPITHLVNGRRERGTKSSGRSRRRPMTRSSELLSSIPPSSPGSSTRASDHTCSKPARPILTFGNLPETLSPDKENGSHCALFVERQRGDVKPTGARFGYGSFAYRMGSFGHRAVVRRRRGARLDHR